MPEVGDTVWKQIERIKFGPLMSEHIVYDDWVSGTVVRVDSQGNCAIRYDDKELGTRVEQRGAFEVDSMHEP